MKGKVKFYDTTKGFGFIEAEDGSEIYVHYTSIAAQPKPKLEKNQTVSFEITEGRRGPEAADVKVIDA